MTDKILRRSEKARIIAGIGLNCQRADHWGLTGQRKALISLTFFPNLSANASTHFFVSGVLRLANTVQAKKRARQAEDHRQHNASMRSMLRTYIKRVIKAIHAGDPVVAQSEYQTAVPIIDRMARKGIIHMNKAARHKSRLTHHIRDMQQS